MVDTSAAPDLLGQLDNLRNHAITPSAFWRWFAVALPGIEHDAPDHLVDLAAQVELRFAEWTSGSITDATLLTALADDVAALNLPGAPYESDDITRRSA